jgi:cell division transport system ATP-binding protein
MAIIRLFNAQIVQQGGSAVLNGVNLELAEGEFAYLIGKTGSGKSSLLKAIYGALALGDGSGQVAGFDLKKLSRKTIPLLRRRLGIVFQDFNLLTDRTVGENLLFVLRATGWKNSSEMEYRARLVLSEVDLLHKWDAMPFQLSGGEQQRVVIARALLNQPALIIADEPTGNLDPETSDDILLLLRRLAKEHNSAVLCATHDYRILQHFPARIIRIVNGKLVDDEGAGLR